MTDIIVTVPKDYDFQDKIDMCNDGYTTSWFIGRRPRYAEYGDKIYFLQNNAVQWVADITQVWDDEIDFINVKEMPQPQTEMKGFRGFRYLEE